MQITDNIFAFSQNNVWLSISFSREQCKQPELPDLSPGLLRWNQDRAAAAVAGGGSTLRIYTGELVYSVNENYNKLYGRKLVTGFTPPTVYTGKDILINAVHDVACFC